MAADIKGVPFKLTAADLGGLGGFGLGEAIRSGLANANLYQEARYKPQTLQADIAQKQGEASLVPYRQKLLEAQSEAAMRPKPIPGKISHLEQLRDRFQPGSENYRLYDTALRNALAGQQGITVYDPQGNPMVQIGGSAGGKGGKGGGGQIYQSPTGEQYQTPTTAVQTNLQQRIVGQKIVEPYLKNIIETLPQFQSGWTKLKTGIEGGLNKWAGTNLELPSQLQKGQAALGLAAEGMLRQFGLNATGHNLKRMEAILTPGEGESVEGYKQRAQDQLLDFFNTAREAQQLSRSGVPVKESNTATNQTATPTPIAGNNLPLDRRNTPNASLGVTPESIAKERQMDIATAKQFNTIPEKVLTARSQGIKTANQFREWLRRNP
jgi:hypothetical protein